MARIEDLESPKKYWEPKGFLTRRTLDKIDKAAKAAAQMLNGTWDWGDRKPPRHNDGSFRAPVRDVMIAGGWNPNSHDPQKYLKSREFAEALKREQMRLDGGFKKVLAEMTQGGSDLHNLSAALWESLMEDMADPERRRRIPFRDRSKLYTELTQMIAKAEGDANTRGGIGKNLEAEFLENLKENTDEVRFREVALKLKQNLDEAQEVVEGVELLVEE